MHDIFSSNLQIAWPNITSYLVIERVCVSAGLFRSIDDGQIVTIANFGKGSDRFNSLNCNFVNVCLPSSSFQVIIFKQQKSLPPNTILTSRAVITSPPTLLDLKSADIAEQMTLLDAELFQKIEIPEVLIWAKEQCEERSPNLTRFTEHFNKMSYW